MTDDVKAKNTADKKYLDIIVKDKYIGRIDSEKFVAIIKLLVIPATKDEQEAYRQKTAQNQKGKGMGQKVS